MLRYYDDFTEVQTAAATGCAVGTVKSQVSAGLTRLRERMGVGTDIIPLPATDLAAQ